MRMLIMAQIFTPKFCAVLQMVQQVRAVLIIDQLVTI